jgi:putative DNA primase/helicase
MPVLEGEQGTGKSTALRYLFGDRFFIDHLPDFHSKDSFQQLQGAWCVEVAELSALTKADVKDVKQFLSRLVDKFRPPFGRLPIQVPRARCFGARSTRKRAATCATRPAPAASGPSRRRHRHGRDPARPRPAVGRSRAAFIAGEKWHLDDDDDIADAKAEQAKRREVHPWEPGARGWLRCRAAAQGVTCPGADQGREARSRPAGAAAWPAGRRLAARARVDPTNIERFEGKVAKVFIAPE